MLVAGQSLFLKCWMECQTEVARHFSFIVQVLEVIFILLWNQVFSIAFLKKMSPTIIESHYFLKLLDMELPKKSSFTQKYTLEVGVSSMQFLSSETT